MLSDAAEQWVRWTWNVCQALFERATQRGQSYEVTEEDVVRALTPPLIAFMDAVRASSRERRDAAASGRRSWPSA